MNSAVLPYWIIAEPQRQSYEALIRFCAKIGAFGTLADLFPTNKAGKEARASFIDKAGSSTLGIEMVERWPIGEPQSGGGKPTPLWKLDLTDDLVNLLVNSLRGLFGWQSPKLPEDLAVYRHDGTVLLGTVAHEHIGWMNLTSEEAADVRIGQIELKAKRH